MIAVKVFTKDLQRIWKVLETRKTKLLGAAAKMLNNIGDKTKQEMAYMISSQTLIPAETVLNSITVKRASSGDLNYHIDATKAFIGMETRPMGSGSKFKQRPEGYFHPKELVNIVSMEDDKVCEICQEAVEHGPYTIEEAQAMLPLHPHCRCLVASSIERRTLPVEFKKKGKAEINTVSIKQLVSKLLKESKIQLKAK